VVKLCRPAATEDFTGRGGMIGGDPARGGLRRQAQHVCAGDRRNGHIVFEKYWGDTTLDSSISTDHFAKVLGPLLVGSVMNDRLIRNLDEPISTYQPDLPTCPTLLPALLPAPASGQPGRPRR
jgi:hypothetical protein